MNTLESSFIKTKEIKLQLEKKTVVLKSEVRSPMDKLNGNRSA